MRGAGSLTMRPGQARCRGLGTATGLWTTPAPERDVPPCAPTRPPPQAHRHPHPGARATTRTRPARTRPAPDEPRPQRDRPGCATTRRTHPRRIFVGLRHLPRHALLPHTRATQVHQRKGDPVSRRKHAPGAPDAAGCSGKIRRTGPSCAQPPPGCARPLLGRAQSPTPPRSPSHAPRAPARTGTPAPARPATPPPCRRAPRAAARCWRRRPPGPRRGRRPRRSRRPRPGR